MTMVEPQAWSEVDKISAIACLFLKMFGIWSAHEIKCTWICLTT